MKISNTQMEMILSRLETQLRMKENEKKETENPLQKLLTGSDWLLREEKNGEYEIPIDLEKEWSRYVRKRYSPFINYQYEEHNLLVNDSRDLYWKFQNIKNMQLQNWEYVLENRIENVCEQYVSQDNLLDEIHERLQEKRYLMLYGIGGIGKSELAKAYIKKYNGCYHTVLFCRFHDNLQETIIDDYQIAIKNLFLETTGKRGERG